MKNIYYIDPHILRSLNKSELRKKILFFLNHIYPNATYLSEIARAVRSDPSNVLGCLKGMENKYNGHSSLIELGLVEIMEKGNIGERMKLYRLSEYGRKVVVQIREYYSKY